jgi:hypothetical protein
MPPIVWVLTVLGLAPFILCGLSAIGHNPDPADRGLALLIDWGAVVLAFLGAVHWGLALGGLPPAGASSAAAPPSASLQRWRFGLGVAPLLVGWAALILTKVVSPLLGIALLIAGLIATLGVEHQAGRHSLLPRGYLTLRWGFTIIAAAMLVTVLTLRLLGQTVVF